MGMVVINKTICPICGDMIREQDETYSFPSFVVNIKDRLYFFNDNTFHKRCLQKNKTSHYAIDYSEAFLEKIRPSNRKCIIGGNLITDQNSHIFIDLLTSNRSDFLHQFNFAHIDKKNLAGWLRREELIGALVNLYKSDLWQESNGEKKYLLRLIQELS